MKKNICVCVCVCVCVMNHYIADVNITLKLNSVCMPSCLSHVQLPETLWTAALCAPLSMQFSRQEY